MFPLHHPLYKYTAKKYRLRYYCLLAATILLPIIMMLVGSSLKTPLVPNGIMALKGENCVECTQAFIHHWSADGVLSYAYWVIALDFLFLIAYGLFFILLILKIGDLFYDLKEMRRAKIIANFFAWVMSFAMLADLVENSATWMLISNAGSSPLNLVYYSGIILMVLLVIASLYCFYGLLFHRGDALLEIWAVLYHCRFSLINIFILYFILWKTPQGQDLLISINENNFHVISLFTFLIIIASMNWLVPRYMILKAEQKKRRSNTRGENDIGRYLSLKYWQEKLFKIPMLESSLEDHYYLKPIHKTIPRLLGVLTILVVYGALRNVLLIMDCPWEGVFDPEKAISPWMQVLLLFTAFILLMSPGIYDRFRTFYYTKQRRNSLGVMLLGVLLFAGVLLLSFLNDGTPKTLNHLSFATLLLAMLFYLSISFRRKLTQEDQQLAKLEKIKVSHFVFRAILFGSLLFVLISGFFPKGAEYTGTIGITMASIIFHMGIFMLLTYIWGKAKAASFLIIFLLLLVAAFVTMNNENKYHDIRTLETSIKASDRKGLEEYFAQWVLDRSSKIKAYGANKYPVFLLASNGGGSRAAYWTAIINSRLNDQTNGVYTDHLFSQSGASGGTVGSAVFTALYLGNDNNSASAKLQPKVNEVYKGDLLSGTIAYLFGKDVWQIFCFWDVSNWEDRSERLEKDYEHLVNTATGKEIFDQPFNELWYEDANTIRTDIPLYFGNTMSVERGRRGLISPVKIDTSIFTDAIDVLDFSDKETIRFSSAVMLCNRFPFVNPAGRLEGKGHFVDGGYYDNTGGQTTLEILNTISKVENILPFVAPSDSANFRALYDQLKFNVIKIDNDAIVQTYEIEQEAQISDIFQDVPEFFIPFAAASNSIMQGRVRFIDQQLEKAAKQKSGDDSYLHLWLPYKSFAKASPIKEDCKNYDSSIGAGYEKEGCRDIMPLGRSLSNYARTKIQERLDWDPVKGQLKAIEDSLKPEF